MRPSATAKVKTLRQKGIHDFLIEKVEMLGSGEVPYRRTSEALEIDGSSAQGDLPVCYRISIG